MKANLNF